MADKQQKWQARFHKDPYARLLGCQTLELAEGYARVSLTLGSQHTNSLATTHGGVIMSLADIAMSYATNTLDTIRLASQFTMSFISPPKERETLTAEARMFHAGKTQGVADLTVWGADSRIVAKGMGTVTTVGNWKD